MVSKKQKTSPININEEEKKDEEEDKKDVEKEEDLKQTDI